MGIMRAQCVFPSDSGLPEDFSVNTFHFSDPNPYSSASGISVIQRLSTFYNAISSKLSNTINQDAAFCKIYALEDAIPRPPRENGSLGISTVGGSSYPREVACVLSFQALQIAGQPQARRRNRVFLGPLVAEGTNGDGEVRPTGDMQSFFLQAASVLRGNVQFGIKWVVRSETTGAIADVNNGWVDNAFDTQRRRGAAPTVRNAF
jgi:hypothetical protein